MGSGSSSGSGSGSGLGSIIHLSSISCNGTHTKLRNCPFEYSGQCEGQSARIRCSGKLNSLVYNVNTEL